MGIGRDQITLPLRPAIKRVHGPNIPAPSSSTSAPAKRKNTRHLLHKIVPKAGMTYLHTGKLLGHPRYDETVKAVLEQASPPEKFLTARKADRLFAAIFEEAATALQEDDAAKFKDTPIAFIKSLKDRSALQDWAGDKIYPERFASLFLTLRASRLSWHETPRQPLNVELHCRVARAIDAFRKFEEAGLLNWSAPQTAEWAICGSLECPKVRQKVKASRCEAKEDEPVDGQDKAAIQVLANKVEARMQMLRIDIEPDVLTKEFSALRKGLAVALRDQGGETTELGFQGSVGEGMDDVEMA